MPPARPWSPPPPPRPDWVLADAVPAPVWLADPDGRPVYFNRAYRKCVGRPLSELLADPWAAVHVADQAAAVARWAACLRAGTPFTAEYRVRRADGAFRWYTAEAAPDVTGLWVGALFDIHACKEVPDWPPPPGDLSWAAECPPIAQWDTPVPDRTPVPGAVPRGEGGTVLLVDPDEDARAAALRALQDAGYVVLDARGPDQAVRVAEAFGVPIHVLVTPVDPPGAGGRELARRLAPAHPGLRVVYLSGAAGATTARDPPAPAPPVLRRPYTLAALVQRVRDALDTRV